MNIAVLLLRVIHIFGAIMWGGGVIMLKFFISPSVAATAQSGQEFAQYLTNKIRVHIFMTVAAISTVLAGSLLYWRDSDGFSSPWMRSSAGIGFGIGALFGFMALISGAIFGNANAQLGKVSAQIQGKPTEEQLAKIQALQKRAERISPFHAITTLLAMLFMATARYLAF